jgi:hypothetical protein
VLGQSLEPKDLLHLWEHVLIFSQDSVDFVMMLSAADVLFRKKVVMRMDSEDVMAELRSPSEMNLMTVLRIAHPLYDQIKIPKAERKRVYTTIALCEQTL